ATEGGQGREPGEHVAELVQERRGLFVAQGARELTDLLDHPAKGRVASSACIAVEVRTAQDVLQLGEVHRKSLSGASAGVEDAADHRQAWQREQRVGRADGAVVPVDAQPTGDLRRCDSGRSAEPEFAVDLADGARAYPEAAARDDDAVEVEGPRDVEHAI